MIEERLLTVAEDLCRRTGRRPRDAFMRRAVSTAYYALFHALSRMCAEELVGADRRAAAWQRVYRALDHRTAKTALQGREASVIAPGLGAAFVRLQDRRHQADYDPRPFGHNYDEALALVRQARTAMEELTAPSSDQRRSLATLLLFKARNAS